MTTALYPASFDPITFGHVDLAERATKLFDNVVVAVFEKPHKNLLFPPEERFEMTRKALAHLDQVKVIHFSGLTAHVAQRVGANVIVRGLRALSDFEWEMQLALANKSFAPGIETICLMTSQRFSFVSSSMVKEIALNGGQVEHLAPAHVVKALDKEYRRIKEAEAQKHS